MTILLPTQKLLPTSTAGSLPKPSWLAEPEKIWSPWALEGEQLLEAKQDALRLTLQEQRHAGIDIVSDGEQTRQHFVPTRQESAKVLRRRAAMDALELHESKLGHAALVRPKMVLHHSQHLATTEDVAQVP